MNFLELIIVGHTGKATSQLRCSFAVNTLALEISFSRKTAIENEYWTRIIFFPELIDVLAQYTVCLTFLYWIFCFIIELVLVKTVKYAIFRRKYLFYC